MAKSGADVESPWGADAVNPDQLRFEPLTKEHDRDGFQSGIAALDRYLKQQALQDAWRYAAAPIVAAAGAADFRIVGFYTLAPTGVDLGAFHGEAAKKLPRYPVVPAILLGRLAVDRRFRGQGCGEALLMDAMARTLRHAEKIGGAAMIVDAKDAAAARFYENYDFQRFSERQDRLFLAMTVIRKLFS